MLNKTGEVKRIEFVVGDYQNSLKWFRPDLGQSKSVLNPV